MGLFIPPRHPPSWWQAICQLLTATLWSPSSNHGHSIKRTRIKAVWTAPKVNLRTKVREKRSGVFNFYLQTQQSCRYHLPVHFYYLSFFNFLKSKARRVGFAAENSGDRVTNFIISNFSFSGSSFLAFWGARQSSRLARGCGGWNQSICAA
jgi:hypothetical protein